MTMDCLGGFGNTGFFLLISHVDLTFGIGSAMPDDFVPSAAKGFNHLGTIVIELGVD